MGVVSTSSISHFSISCKKHEAANMEIIPEDKVLYCKIERNELYNGTALTNDEYLPTVQYFIGIIQTFINTNSFTSHITQSIITKIISACNQFKEDDNYLALQVILPEYKGVKYTKNDCDVIRNTVKNELNLKTIE